MKNKEVDFSKRVEEIRLEEHYELGFKDRLHKTLDYLACKYSQQYNKKIKETSDMTAYARGYLDEDVSTAYESKMLAGLMRALLFVRMESGKPVPYNYKKIDQDLSNTTLIFDDKERQPLKFNKAQFIEAKLLANKFGLLYEEEDLSCFCEEFVTF